MKSHRKRNRLPKRKRIQKKQSKNISNDEVDVMDDVMAQLRRQREKQTLDEAAPSELLLCPFDTTDKQTTHKPIGKFRYDPILKRYLPKSAYKSNGNNDACIQRLQQVYCKRNDANDTKLSVSSLNVSGRLFLSGVMNDQDIRKVIFRGIALRATSTYGSSSSTSEKMPQKRITKHRKHKMDIPAGAIYMEEKLKTRFECTQKSIILLATSLSYCSSERRKNIASILGPMCISHGLEVVGTIMTKTTSQDTIGKAIERKVEVGQHQPIANADLPTNAEANIQARQSWLSMLHPICLGHTERWVYNDTTSSIPIDCYSKSYLLPTASSFDIMPSTSSAHPYDISLPHIITITKQNEVNYRAPIHIPSYGLGAFGITKEWCNEEYCADVSLSDRRYEFQIDEPGVPGNIHGIRLANLKNYRGCYGGLSIGCVTYDSKNDQSHFALHCLSDHKVPKLSSIYHEITCGGVNDFCFGGPNIHSAAFACTTRRGAAVSHLNLCTNQIITHKLGTQLSDSDPLSIQYRVNQSDDTLLCGHRNGIVSMIDTRSASFKMVVSLSRYDFKLKFGSVSSIHQLCSNEHLVIAKGSFGSCCIFDMRRCGKPSSLLKYCSPSDVHCTKSVNCIGLAVDPNESVVISPYVTQKNEVMAALWSIRSGQLLQTLKLDYSTNDDGRCPLFCELKAPYTSGFRLSLANKSSGFIERKNWGVWYKIGSVSEQLPAGAGGIHHLSF